MVFIVDVARMQERAQDAVVNLTEAGVRRRVSKGILMSGGVGVGLGPNSPKVQFTFGVEQSF